MHHDILLALWGTADQVFQYNFRALDVAHTSVRFRQDHQHHNYMPQVRNLDFILFTDSFHCLVHTQYCGVFALPEAD